MKLTIILQIPVTDEGKGQQLVDIVKQKLIDHPEISVIATVNQEITPSPPE